MYRASIFVVLVASFLSVALAAPFLVAIRAGLTLDQCDSDTDCVGDRTCAVAVGRCLPPSPRPCSSVQNCEAGEVCVLEETVLDGTFCVSGEFVGTAPIGDGDLGLEGSPGPDELDPSPSDEADDDSAPGTSPEATPEAVCVDASALEHLEEHELVFAKHVTSRVLCDLSGSCATKGHMVVWKGNAMMMRSYCDLVGCEEKVIKVNSPKYRRGLRVSTKTEGLEFTAFAARYESTAEEGVLKAAVRVGL